MLSCCRTYRKQAWGPYSNKNILCLRKDAERATKLITGFSDVKYEVTCRLEKLRLTTLQTRRLKGNLIEVFKIFKGYDDIRSETVFVISQSDLMGRSLA